MPPAGVVDSAWPAADPSFPRKRDSRERSEQFLAAALRSAFPSSCGKAARSTGLDVPHRWCCPSERRLGRFCFELPPRSPPLPRPAFVGPSRGTAIDRSEEHTSELQSRQYLV